MSDSKKIPYYTYLTKEQHEAVRALAARTKTNQAIWIRIGVDLMLEKYKEAKFPHEF